MSAESQTQAGELIGIHRRATGADSHPHDALVGKKAIQIQFPFA
ncbi:MAG: hypothetical protein R3C99_25210 [Pirellulaceae bacterium]